MHVQVTSPTDILEELGEELDGDEEVINNSKDRNKDDKLQEVDMANANEIRAASSLAGTQCGDEEQHKGLDTTIENLVVRFEDKKRRKLETTKVQADVAQPPDITVHVTTSNSNAGSKAEQVNSTHGEDRNKIESEIILIAFDTNKSAKFLNENPEEYLRFLKTQKIELQN